MGAVMDGRADVWIRTEDPSAVGAVRRAAAELAREAGFDATRTGEVGVAVSEAVSNLVKHAVDGVVLLRPHPEMARAVELVAIDSGPGIADLGQALRDGYSTTGTLGIGLGAIRRLASRLDAYSLPGRGSVLVAVFTPHGMPAPPQRCSGLCRPIGEEVVCGDAFAFVATEDSVIVTVCDGLGHGGAAAQASQQAVRIFLEQPHMSPAEILERVHRGLGQTRGGAVAVGLVRPGSVSFAGLGNVSGLIVTAEGKVAMTSQPGIAGHPGGLTQQYEYPLPQHAVVVFHSDGLSDRWEPTTFPGLLTHSPAVICATLLRDVGTRRDDACVVAVRARP